MPSVTCPSCAGTVIEYSATAGNGFCVSCGTVVEENTIVSEITFGETSGGAAMVQGSYVGQGATRARMNGPFGNRGNMESREQTMMNANKKIKQIAAALHLSEITAQKASRYYELAVEVKFTKGRKSIYVVACCLYCVCREKKGSQMLIDFSDLLQVNVFELGHTYLQLVQTLSLHLPLVDPSHYIARFAALLEFGDETPRVALDATRLVSRFSRDWIQQGRRPSGICGACLLIAARMNNFRRSVQEIVQVVKIADSTLVRRLEEFGKTGSGSLTVQDFRSVWLEEENDPPAFGKEEERQRKKAEREEKENNKKKKKGKKRKRKRGESEEAEAEADADDERVDEAPDAEEDLPAAAATVTPSPVPVDPHLLNEGILAGVVSDTLGPSNLNGDPLFLPDDSTATSDLPPPEIDPALLGESDSVPPDSSATVIAPTPDATLVDDPIDNVLSSEVTHFLTNDKGTDLTSALDQAETARLAKVAENVVDELQGLDEEELDRMLLTEEEVKIKERVWVEINYDYLVNIAKRGESTSTEKSRKRRKTNKNKDSSLKGSTPSESVRNLVKKAPKKFSKRINYDAIESILGPGAGPVKEGSVPLPLSQDDEYGDLVPMEQDADRTFDEGEVVVEEAEPDGGVGMQRKTPTAAESARSDGEEIIEDYWNSEGGGGDDTYDVDVYEQEVD
ncbi:cyclin-like protein [Sistotremastrum niveocremeum HHB9708]|uniref:B-related factor 1 n=2 Tax=Sistotremastraceae TaxID=3402574 RepID=A0A164WLS6_9AGAM|nr:cyclin-like protein [Sistotremastrum niveocremeum HHB9708]KZT40943.1 cyclin-like protein [Sistotremastrum suecicum HHB10207 ss-3]